MAELVGGAVLGTAVGVLYESLKALIVKNLTYASILEEIISRLDYLKPLIQQMTDKYSEEELQGLQKVIEEGKVLVGGYLVHGKNPKKKDVEKFGEWDDRLKQQLEMLKLQSIIDVRKTTSNTEAMVPMMREIRTMVQSTLNRSDKDTDKENQAVENEAYCAVPELPTLTVGLDVPVKQLKRRMFDDDKPMIVVNAMGGSGKTTLAINFCRDPEVTEKFKHNIFFVTVSEEFNFKLIVQDLHERKGLKVPDFTSAESAVPWLQRFLRNEEHSPFLLVLDDVWPESADKYLGKFQFKEMKDSKILVTSRSQLLRFANEDSHYKLEPLNDDDAMILFNHSTKGSPYPELSNKIVDSCIGSPLALTVVGGSLSGEPIEKWQKISSEGHSIISHRDEVSDSLQRSLDVLDEKTKQYFLDLGAFPDHRRITVGALIDMWAGLYGPTPYTDGLSRVEEDEKEDAMCNAELINLKRKNLVNLIDTRKDKIDADGYRKGNYVILHDRLKELAILNSGIGPEELRTRLIVHIRGNDIPKWWREHKDLQARLLSVSTDSLFSKKLPNIGLKEAEVLILNFRTKKYIVPEFVEKMPELKVLFVKYDGIDGYSYAELDGFKQLGSLPNLKRITLESLSMRSMTENPFILNSLLKMSLIQCDLGRHFNNGCVKILDAFPNLEELIIDRCYDCKEFLTECCDLLRLTKLSIINCHGLYYLPETIGKLVNLQVFRLRSCEDLSILPDSLVNLENLMFLDISECSSIGRLPINIGELSRLTKLDLRHCWEWNELRQSVDSVLRLKQLKEVICTCSQATKELWEAVKADHGTIITIIEIIPIPEVQWWRGRWRGTRMAKRLCPQDILRGKHRSGYFRRQHR